MVLQFCFDLSEEFLHWLMLCHLLPTQAYLNTELRYKCRERIFLTLCSGNMGSHPRMNISFSFMLEC